MILEIIIVEDIYHFLIKFHISKLLTINVLLIVGLKMKLMDLEHIKFLLEKNLKKYKDKIY